MTTADEAARTQTVGGTTGVADFGGLTPGVTYSGQVVAINTVGETASATAQARVAALTGMVIASVVIDGTALADHDVELTDGEGNLTTGTTDSSGSVRFPELDPGDYTLAVIWGDFGWEATDVTITVVADQTTEHTFNGTAIQMEVVLAEPIADIGGLEDSVQYFTFTLTPPGAPQRIERAGASLAVDAAVSGAVSAPVALLNRRDRPTPLRALSSASVTQTTLRITTGGGTGDADVCSFVGDVIDLVCSTGGATEELIEVVDPPNGTWTVLVHGFTEFSGMTLQVEVLGDNPATISNFALGSRPDPVSVGCPDGFQAEAHELILDWVDPNGDINDDDAFWLLGTNGGNPTDWNAFFTMATATSGTSNSFSCWSTPRTGNTNYTVMVVDKSGLSSNQLAVVVPPAS